MSFEESFDDKHCKIEFEKFRWKKLLEEDFDIVNLNLNITFILKLLSCLQEFSFK